ncbi:MAG: ferrous iron transporter B [Cyanobacteria bacterium NC_groundwater_1444_Ag_S-0.65um_54_12]|nr:ferrous iron transporter B [Cyanobacteria bacterium NC_groundwater_1444_Ag_S-0.65um_54_12]
MNDAALSDEQPSSAQRVPLIFLVGQPNSGKTTLFNALTGSRFRAVNYPGATVEYSVGQASAKFRLLAQILDSPGLNSLNACSPDEELTVEALFHHPKFGIPDLILLVVDATQLSRHLYLAQQIHDSGFRMVLAVTMTDLLAEKGCSIDTKSLGEQMDCPTVAIDSRTGKGLMELVAQCRGELLETVPAVRPRPMPPKDDAEVCRIYQHVEDIERSVIGTPVRMAQANIPLHTPNERTVHLDSLFLHPIWGLLLFVLSMVGIFTSIFWLAQPAMDTIDQAFGWLANLIHSWLPDTLPGDFLADGLVMGLGSVAMFLPQIFILFFAMGILEDTGYLARGAMLVDRPLAKIGLNGRSFVPMLSGFACAIPGIMAARTIPSKRERLLTIFIMPLMSCSARLPVYALLLGFLTPSGKPWIGGLGLTALYFGSLLSGAVVVTIASRLAKRYAPSPFMLELPAYRRPQLRIILRSTSNRAMNYLRKATIPIVSVATAIWALTYFSVDPSQSPSANLLASDRLAHSWAAAIGHWLDPLMGPLGFDWRVGVALVATFAAREVFVSSLALLLKVTAEGDALQGALHTAMHSATLANGAALFTTASVVGLLIYFVIAMQCLTTFVVSRKESGSLALAISQLVLFNLLAYLLASMTTQGLRWLGIT